jgi:hypothetical protein
MAYNYKLRVPIPITDRFRAIAKAERRSIALQAQIAIEQFTQNWPNNSPRSASQTRFKQQTENQIKQTRSTA